MTDYIKREEAIKATWQEPTYTDPLNVLTEVRDRIEAIRAADVEEVRHGHWVLRHIGHGHMWECSVCGKQPCIYITNGTHYCPNCGAKMEEESK